MYGINPGGMAASGDSPDAAHAAFRKAFSQILIDIANDAESFEAFQSAVATFFDDTNSGYEADWQQAILAVRRGEVSLEGIPLVPANSPRTIVVTAKEVAKLTTQDNSANLQYLLAA